MPGYMLIRGRHMGMGTSLYCCVLLVVRCKQRVCGAQVRARESCQARVCLQCILHPLVDVAWQLLRQLLSKPTHCVAYALLRLPDGLVIVEDGTLLLHCVGCHVL